MQVERNLSEGAGIPLPRYNASRLRVPQDEAIADEDEIVVFKAFDLARLFRIQELLQEAACVAECQIAEVVPTFDEKWREVKQVLQQQCIDPLKVTVAAILDFVPQTMTKIEEFCRWYHASREKILAVG